MYKNGQNSAADYSSTAAQIFIRLFLSNVAEQSASWQRSASAVQAGATLFAGLTGGWIRVSSLVY